MRLLNLGNSDKGGSGVAGVALAFAAFGLMGADVLPPWLRSGAVMALFVLSGIFLYHSPRLRRILRALAALFLSAWLHRDQSKAAAENPYYRDALQDHRRLLGISRWKIAGESGIPYLAICFFARFPEYIPRPEFLEGLCKALLLPEEYFREGGSYGLGCSCARLLRYDHLGLGHVFTWARIKDASQEELDEIVSKVEALRREGLREGLRKDGKVS